MHIPNCKCFCYLLKDSCFLKTLLYLAKKYPIAANSSLTPDCCKGCLCVCASVYRLNEQAPHSISHFFQFLLTSRFSKSDHSVLFFQSLSFKIWEEAYNRILLNFNSFPLVHCTGQQVEQTRDHLPISSIFFPYTWRKGRCVWDTYNDAEVVCKILWLTW